MLPDGRLGVLDFGAVNRLPDGFPPAIGRLLALALGGDHDAVLEGLRAEGFVNPGHQVDPDELINYLNPFLDPARQPTFHFSRAWLREQAARVGDPRTQAAAFGRQLNLPPSYLLDPPGVARRRRRALPTRCAWAVSGRDASLGARPRAYALTALTAD